MAEVDPQVRTVLEETRFLITLQGSLLFAFNALIPLSPLGRQVIVRGGPPGEAGPFTAAQIEALVVVVGLGMVAVFLPLYVRLLIRALESLKGGDGK
jgi:hypothetical protein